MSAAEDSVPARAVALSRMLMIAALVLIGAVAVFAASLITSGDAQLMEAGHDEIQQEMNELDAEIEQLRKARSDGEGR